MGSRFVFSLVILKLKAVEIVCGFTGREVPADLKARRGMVLYCNVDRMAAVIVIQITVIF